MDASGPSSFPFGSSESWPGRTWREANAKQLPWQWSSLVISSSIAT